jgi:hypothetical protein
MYCSGMLPPHPQYYGKQEEKGEKEIRIGNRE